jgi:hypothetical protein
MDGAAHAKASQFQTINIKEATQFRKEAQGTPPGFERELLVRKARRAETASRMIEWLTSAPKHQDRFK